MKNYRFESAYVLQFLWLIPILFAFFIFYAKRADARLRKIFAKRIGDFLTSSLSNKKRLWKLQLQMLALVFMIIAYARPQNAEGRQQVKNEGIELLFVVDVSNSMLTADIRPSRLQVVRTELNRFIDLSGGDRMGIVAFAGSAALLSPMTTDKDALHMYVDSLNTDSVSTQGTNFTQALTEAYDALQRGGLGHEDGMQVTRAVLVISDGEDHEPGAYDQAKKMIKEGIHIFTLGVGTEQGGYIPLEDDNGNFRGYKKGSDGQPILSKTSGTVLKELASIGEGSFHHLTFQGDAIKAVRADIEKLKKTQFESGEMQTYGEEFQWFLGMALMLALIELWLGERKAKGRIWQGRFEVSHD